ncbi:hypothetical protein HLH34_18530 [Gluconacetobacter azotocaptans]|uniref:Uncharacterized protein n=1 Tax=Gluconacetobacter azotocaptans TaxID=142834 RepID=A0A7W4JVZ9_9PROT|nr:hypothetical protein [Gluconacetobacter azotocaptans]MBB2191931.1 hypothetical protein [Gluconacetobacter azotocaptans]GBQ32768.1 hypothetical protein AA13594_2472 [Gluconacetobacter azotocaptans DSM 13594]
MAGNGDSGDDDGRIVLDLVDAAAFAGMAGDAGALVLTGQGVLDDAAAPARAGWQDVIALRATLSPFGHGVACVCCVPSGGFTSALSDLFRARVTGQRPWFDRVVIVMPAEQLDEVRREVTGHRVVAARYRPGPGA